MTTSTHDAVTSKYIPDVPVGQIGTHPDNPRHDIGNIDNLAASIKDHGVLEPLVVIPYSDVTDLPDPTPDQSAVILIAGHRRLAAAELANVTHVPVLMRYDLKTRDEQIAAMVIENQHRANLSPIEEGEAYQLLLDITPDTTQAKVAAAVGMPKKRVSERVRLTKLNDTARAAIHDGQLSLTDALDLLTIEQRHPDLAEKAALAAGTPDFKYEMQRARQDADILDRYDRFHAKAKELGTPLLEKAPTYHDGQPRKVGTSNRGITIPDDTNPAHIPLAIGEAHADCPGAALYIPGVPSAVYELGWYCTQFDKHHAPTREEKDAQRAEEEAQRERDRAAREEARLASLTDEERAEEQRQAEQKAAEQQARQERRAALQAAQATRRAHFLDVIQQAEPALAKWAAHDLLTYGVEMYAVIAGDLSCALLGIPEDTPYAEKMEQAAKALDKLTLEQLALYQWVVAHEYTDDELVLKYWQDHVDPDTDYITALRDRFGYRWSTVETQEFDLDEHGHVRSADAEAGDAA